MTGIEPPLVNMGGLRQDQLDPPAAPVNAPSAFSSVLGDKAPLDFVPISISPLSPIQHF